MTRRRRANFATLSTVVLALSACGGEDRPRAPDAGAAPSVPEATEAELTPEQMEKGIGPVTRVELGPPDAELAARGEENFTELCSACHRLDERYVGPPLGDVLERRTPEFVMNMILNPGEMVEKHPTVRALLGEYYTPMPDQGVAEEQARAILEYLRREGGAG